MKKMNDHLKKGEELFYKKVNSHMDSIKKIDRERDARHRIEKLLMIGFMGRSLIRMESKNEK